MTLDPLPLAAEISSHELQSAVMRLARRIRQNSADDRATESQMAALLYLHRRGPATPGEISAFQRVTAPSMNRTVNSLAAAGYVRRSPSPGDRRRVMVILTPSGRALVHETLSRRDAWLDIVLGGLEADEREILLAALPVLRKLTEP